MLSTEVPRAFKQLECFSAPRVVCYQPKDPSYLTWRPTWPPTRPIFLLEQLLQREPRRFETFRVSERALAKQRKCLAAHRTTHRAATLTTAATRHCGFPQGEQHRPQLLVKSTKRIR